MLTNLRDDVRLGLRSLLHDRGFALAATLSIGLGVGANSALFPLVDQALLRMLPVRDAVIRVRACDYGIPPPAGWRRVRRASAAVHGRTDLPRPRFGICHISWAAR